ncbi:MAG TPA: helix-turn-helix transcriptional regulator [Gammaproteobacteria bacterium]|nr:helix-turn-helix transcriptional regulator [Gammaproteobacteria bacterium]
MTDSQEIKKITFTDSKKFKVMLPGKEQPIYLTQREAMIVALMMIGQRAKQIAWKLEISLHTVNSHMANIKHKLDCSTNFEVGYRLGWFKYHQEQVTKHWR